jgi:hypothetical protein
MSFVEPVIVPMGQTMIEVLLFRSTLHYMENDAPHKRSAASAANLRDDCAPEAPEAPRAAAAFFALWQQTLRDAASLEGLPQSQAGDQDERNEP